MTVANHNFARAAAVMLLVDEQTSQVGEPEKLYAILKSTDEKTGEVDERYILF